MYQGRYQGMNEHTSSPLRGSVFAIKEGRKFVLNWNTSNHIFQTPSLRTPLAAIITIILYFFLSFFFLSLIFISVLRQAHSVFQSDRLHPLSVSSNLSFP